MLGDGCARARKRLCSRQRREAGRAAAAAAALESWHPTCGRPRAIPTPGTPLQRRYSTPEAPTTRLAHGVNHKVVSGAPEPRPAVLGLRARDQGVGDRAGGARGNGAAPRAGKTLRPHLGLQERLHTRGAPSHGLWIGCGGVSIVLEGFGGPPGAAGAELRCTGERVGSESRRASLASRTIHRHPTHQPGRQPRGRGERAHCRESEHPVLFAGCGRTAGGAGRAGQGVPGRQFLVRESSES